MKSALVWFVTSIVPVAALGEPGLPALRQEVAAEVAARQQGDAALQGALDAEIAARRQGDADTLAQARAYADAHAAAATTAYLKRGQWYDGNGHFSQTFATGEGLLALELPAGDYLLTAHVFAMPESADAGDLSILCSVGRDGGPVGSGEAKWLAAIDRNSTVAVLALGTYSLAADGIADVRCYTSSSGRLAVAQASLTALRIDRLVVQ
jgi:hypothetical protein